MPQEYQATILTVNSGGRTGTLRQNDTAQEYDFEVPRAVPEVIIGDTVIIIKIDLPTNKVLAIVVRKGNS